MSICNTYPASTNLALNNRSKAEVPANKRCYNEKSKCMLLSGGAVDTGTMTGQNYLHEEKNGTTKEAISVTLSEFN